MVKPLPEKKVGYFGGRVVLEGSTRVLFGKSVKVDLQINARKP